MTLRLAWTTDIHLNFLDEKGIKRFCKEILKIGPDILIISGDIGEAHNVEKFLLDLEKYLGITIYFVLGNHDFYRGSIKKVRAAITRLTEKSENLIWLTNTGIVELTPRVGLLGHDSWSDGRFGDYRRSTVMLNDYLLIHELSGLTTRERYEKLNELGDEAARYVLEFLPKAFEKYQKVFFVTHPPPYEEACWHKGKISDENWLPHFSCKAVGEALTEVMANLPEKELVVLCGHTHGRGFAQIHPNLTVRSGLAVYGSPAIEELIELQL